MDMKETASGREWKHLSHNWANDVNETTGSITRRESLHNYEIYARSIVCYSIRNTLCDLDNTIQGRELTEDETMSMGGTHNGERG
jgi:hypothetical protein